MECERARLGKTDGWPGAGVVVFNAVNAGMEGPRSSATVANFKTRCAARRPICAVLARPWQSKEVQSCPKKREISARRGSRTRRRGSVMPLRGNLFKTMAQFSYV